MKQMETKRYWATQILLLFLGLGNLLAQPAASNSTTEHLYLITDRDVYCVEEPILIKILSDENTKPAIENWSHVVYADLVSPYGRIIATQKFDFSTNVASGKMGIPRNVLSGNYYIRAYTKWMRNQPLSSFFFKPVKIINPFTTELLPNVAVLTDSIPFETKEKQDPTFISLKTETDTISVNSTFQLTIGNTGKESTNLMVSIVPKGSNSGAYYVVPPTSINNSDIKYIPETRGVSLTGKVINQYDSLPVPYAQVWITLLKEKTLTSELMADSAGRFYFDLGEEYGHHELFVQATSTKPTVVPITMIDNDYAYSAMNLPFTPFKINDEEKELAERIIIDGQLENIFKKQEPTDTTTETSSVFFYGKPDQVLFPDKYIEMPSLYDYIFELIPHVKLKNDASRQVFKIEGSYPELSIFEPLVMVDQVKIANANDIMKISPKEIDRIELINEPYTRGEITYGGIIHFVSKSHKLENMKFPDQSILLDYELLSHRGTIENSATTQESPKVGNCLYWAPSLVLGPNKETTMVVNTGCEPGAYEVIIEGLGPGFVPFQAHKSIIVQKTGNRTK
jgi:hypothetical protein